MRRPVLEAVDGLEPLLKVLLEFRNVAPLMPAVALAVVVYLGMQPEHGARMAVLERLLSISQQRTRYMCRSLADKGLVRLTPAPEDRRSVLVQLTAKGLRLINK